jgi:ribosomal protein L37AE/L43A
VTVEYYEEDDWRCPDCGEHAVEQWPQGDMWVVSCAGCGMTISDSYIGND